MPRGTLWGHRGTVLLCCFKVTFLLLLNRVIRCQEARERKVAPVYTILSLEVSINNGYLNNIGELVPLCR